MDISPIPAASLTGFQWPSNSLTGLSSDNSTPFSESSDGGNFADALPSLLQSDGNSSATGDSAMLMALLNSGNGNPNADVAALLACTTLNSESLLFQDLEGTDQDNNDSITSMFDSFAGISDGSNDGLTDLLNTLQNANGGANNDLSMIQTLLGTSSNNENEDATASLLDSLAGTG